MPGERAVCILKYRFLGDAVLSTPLLHRLAERYPEPTVLASPHVCQLLAGESGMKLVSQPLLRGTRTFLRELVSLRRQRFDLAVLVNRNYRSALLARMAGIRRRIGHDTEGRGWLLTDRVPYPNDVFEGECYADLGKPLDLNVASRPPRLTVSDAERAQGAERLRGAVIGLQPGSTVADRTIPSSAMAEIANALGGPVALFGGPDEVPYAETVKPLITGTVFDLVGSCTLRETMGALSGLKVFIAADSGLVHICAGLGIPTLTTFSLTPAQKWGHDYAPHRVFTAPNGLMRDMDVAAVIAAARNAVALSTSSR